MKHVDLEKPRCTQRECKPDDNLVDEYRKMFESRIFAGATGRLPDSEKSGVLRCGTTSEEMRGTVLRYGKQKHGAVVSGLHTMSSQPSVQ